MMYVTKIPISSSSMGYVMWFPPPPSLTPLGVGDDDNNNNNRIEYYWGKIE